MKKRSLLWIMLLMSCFGFFTVEAQNCNNTKLIIDQDFNGYNGQNRQYSLNMLRSDFPNVSARTSGEIRGIGPNWPQESRVINGELRAQYIKNAASGRNGGFLFDSSFDGAEEATLEYRVKFDKNFVWATGGKLPGLGGASTANGSLPAGCTQNQNTIQNAFSCRLMWRRNRAQTQAPYIIVYPYFPDRDTRCGGDLPFIRDIKKNRWYTIKQYIKLNTPGQKNGILRMYVDGELKLERKDILFRLAGKGNVKINSLVMHTYRGGNATDPVWQSPTTDYAYFDDVKVWTNCTGGGNPPSNKKPVVNFTNPSGNKTVTEGYNSLIAVANASDPDGSVSNVKLYINNSLVRQENVTPYEWGHAGSPDPKELTGLSAGNYTIKVVATDNDGATAEDTFTLTVKKNGDPDPDPDPGNCSFGTPASRGIAAKNKVTYSNVYIVGSGGPSLSNFRKFTINWNPGNNGVYQFAINTNNGSPSWYVDFKNTMSFQLKNARPEVTLRNTGFSGLDGSYWVAETSNSLILVSKTKGYSIHFSNASTRPSCSNKANEITDAGVFAVAKNPFGNQLVLSNIASDAIQVQLFDYSGKSVIQSSIGANVKEIRLETGDLSAGIYFVQMRFEGKEARTVKVIKF